MKQIVSFLSILFMGLGAQAQQLQLPTLSAGFNSQYEDFEILKDAADKVAETGVVDKLFFDTNWMSVAVGEVKTTKLLINDLLVSINLQRVRSSEDVGYVAGQYAHATTTIIIYMHDDMGGLDDFKRTFYHEFAHFLCEYYGIYRNVDETEQEFVCELLATQYSDLAVAEGVEWLELILENKTLRRDAENLTLKADLYDQVLAKVEEMEAISNALANLNDSVNTLSEEEFEKNREAFTQRAKPLLSRYDQLLTESNDLLSQIKILELTQEKYSPSYPEDMELWNRMFAETTYGNNLQRFYGYERNIVESFVGDKSEHEKEFVTQLRSEKTLNLQIPVKKDFKKIKKVEVAL